MDRIAVFQAFGPYLYKLVPEPFDYRSQLVTESLLGRGRFNCFHYLQKESRRNDSLTTLGCIHVYWECINTKAGVSISDGEPNITTASVGGKC